MARRSNALIPLSWDHHQGLNLARTIRETLAGDTRFGDPSPDEMRALVARKWEHELAGHFRDEEEVLGPLGRESPAISALLARMREEHRAIQELVAAVAASKGDDTQPLSQFANALQAHIRFEERELFEAVEAHLGEPQRQTLGRALLAHRENDGRSSERERRAIEGQLFED